MKIDQTTAVKLTQWYSTFNCSCSASSRVQRLFGSLGGGVSASKIRSTGASAAISIIDQKNPLPDRVAEVMTGVMLERALSTPDVIMSIFGLTGSTVYCGCNSTRPNYNTSTMMVWEDTKNGSLRITCPECSTSMATSANPVSLPAFLRRQLRRSDLTKTERETLNVYSALVSAAGGCGRSVHQQCQPATFRGSWTSLILVEDGIDAEFLVSNAVSCSLRLQHQCVCSDILYIMTPLIASDPERFAFSPLCVQVVGGGEYLYCRYSIFRIGGKLDMPQSTPTVEQLFNQEQSLSSDSLKRELEQRLSKRGDCHGPKRSAATVGTDDIDIRSMLQTVLFKGAVNSRNPSKTTNRLYEAVEAAVDGKIKGNTTELVLPPPQIQEVNVAQHLRRLKSERIGVSLNNTGSVNVDVAKITPQRTSTLFYPPVCNLVCPPIISRTAFNRYKIMTGLGAFFDRIEVENTAPVVLDDQSIHGAFLQLLSTIKENYIAKSLDTQKVSTVDVPSNIGVTISRSEIIQRQLCKSTTLKVLASLLDPPSLPTRDSQTS